MGGSNCVVTGCSNSTIRIYKWRAEPCTIHEGQSRKECGCWTDPSYKLYCFPNLLRNNDKRKRWIAALRRVNKDKSAWKPCSSDRVCSKHFVDGFTYCCSSRPHHYIWDMIFYSTVQCSFHTLVTIFAKINVLERDKKNCNIQQSETKYAYHKEKQKFVT